jgi:hypothetical protein
MECIKTSKQQSKATAYFEKAIQLGTNWMKNLSYSHLEYSKLLLSVSDFRKLIAI